MSHRKVIAEVGSTGAHGAFCVTNFRERFSPEKELAQARAMAETAKADGVAHVVWSTLEDTRERAPLDDGRMPTLMGRFPGAEDLGNTFQSRRDFSAAFCALRDLAFTRSLHPDLKTFSAWLSRNGARIPRS